MYREAVKRVVDRLSETDAFHRAGLVAIDTTEEDPFTGDREGHEDEIIGTKEKTDEYAYQWATVQLVGNAAPLVLDARPVKKVDSRREIGEDLLDSGQDLVHVDGVLMDREFDSQHLLESISERRLTYVVPKRMYSSEKAQAKRLLRRGQDYYTADRKLHLGRNEWHETTFVYKRNPNADRTDYGQYAVFLTNAPVGAVREYSYRWEIESGYKSIKRFMAATISKDFVLRFFYFVFACLLYSIWRAVNLNGYRRANILDAQTSALGYIFPWSGGVLVGYTAMAELPGQYDWFTAEMVVNPVEVVPFVFHGWQLVAVFILAAITGFGREYLTDRESEEVARI